MPKVDRGKAIVSSAGSVLSGVRGSVYDLLTSQQVEELDSLLREASELQHHRLVMDGGVSFNAFWDGGEELFAHALAWIGSLADVVAGEH